jgi:hypothetical protein
VKAATGDPLADTEAWFRQHGLPFFVPEERDAARAALHSRRTLLMLAVTVLLATAGGVALAMTVEDVTAVPTTIMVVVGLAAFAYGATTLRARPIVTWAVARTLRSIPQLLPMATRALPLLLVFITFLFINAEVWEVSARLDGSLMVLTVLLFGTVAAIFLLVRLPDELDEADDVKDEAVLVEACRHTPLAAQAQELLERAGRAGIAELAEVRGFEKANLILVLAIAQAVQVLLLALSVFAFFLVFGGVVMDEKVQEHWTGGTIHHFRWLDHLSVELLQVSVFLAAFSGLYFTVYAVTDEAYRDQFFSGIKRELERAVGVRAVYVALRGGASPGSRTMTES